MMQPHIHRIPFCIQLPFYTLYSTYHNVLYTHFIHIYIHSTSLPSDCIHNIKFPKQFVHLYIQYTYYVSYHSNTQHHTFHPHIIHKSHLHSMHNYLHIINDTLICMEYANLFIHFLFPLIHYKHLYICHTYYTNPETLHAFIQTIHIK